MVLIPLTLDTSTYFTTDLMQILLSLVIAGYIGTCELKAPDSWKNCDTRWGMVVGWMFESPLTAFKSYLRKKQDPTASSTHDIEHTSS